jgi:hypothetical protein
MVASYIETLRSSPTHDPYSAAIGKSRSRAQDYLRTEGAALSKARKYCRACRAKGRGEVCRKGLCLSEISRRKIVIGEDFWKGKHDQGRRGGDIAHKREIVLHAQEQAMIGRVTVRGLLWTMWRDKSKHHTKKTTAYSCNFEKSHRCR